jgi:hypothetical protein
MKLKFLTFIILSLLLFNPSYAKYGSGPLKLDKSTMESVIMYMYGAGNKKYSGNAKRKNDPLIMVISQNSKGYFYQYCPTEWSGNCMKPKSYQITKKCEQYSNGSPCFVFAVKRRIVWKNGGPKLTIKKKDLKSPYVVAKKIQEAGFYDGDISELAGIDISTGQIDEDKKIIGKKENKNNNNNKKSSNIVEELETLTKLYENGSLSNDEFDKAKNKLFNE